MATVAYELTPKELHEASPEDLKSVSDMIKKLGNDPRRKVFISVWKELGGGSTFVEMTNRDI